MYMLLEIMKPRCWLSTDMLVECPAPMVIVLGATLVTHLFVELIPLQSNGY